MQSINFNCSNCNASISAKPSDAGLSSNCPSCNHELIIPQVLLNVRKSPLIPVQKKSSVKSKKYTIPIIVFIILIITLIIFVPRLTKWRRDRSAVFSTNNDQQSSLPLIPSKMPAGGVFWKFKFGSAYDDCIKIMKTLKAEGIVSDLSVGSRFGGTPGNISVSGETESNLNGILTIPCSRISLSFEDKLLDSIELNYGFKIDHRGNLFDTLVKDMERLMKVKAVIEIKENDVGDRTKTATIEKNSIRIKVSDKLDGGFSEFAPEILISTPQ